MTTKEISQFSEGFKSNWVYYVLILLVGEKIIQHIVVTLTFHFNWADIGSTVVVSPRILMTLGVPVSTLFAVSLWGMIKKQRWVVNLVVALALFEIIGEFVAQGRFGIVITASFIVAILF
jgi:hypothetical protein